MQGHADALQPADMPHAHTLATPAVFRCATDDECGSHGVCVAEEAACACDLGYYGHTCSTEGAPDTARGSTNTEFWKVASTQLRR